MTDCLSKKGGKKRTRTIPLYISNSSIFPNNWIHIDVDSPFTAIMLTTECRPHLDADCRISTSFFVD